MNTIKRAFFNLLAKLIQEPGRLAAFARVVRRTRQPEAQPLETWRESGLRSISIWNPELRAGEVVFVRPAQQIFGDHYAAMTSFKLEKAPGVMRICYFGESAALGYLYAPHFSPAEYLEQVLNTRRPDRVHEVIDLSMTNETLDSLLHKFEAAMQLKPDICVVFAGNNWSLLETPEFSPNATNAESRLKMGRILREAGIDALSDLVVKQRLEKIGQAYGDIHEIAGQSGADVIVVIPEANLADWESRQPPPLLNAKQTNAWHKLYADCEDLIRRHAWNELLDTAFKMWDLDQGACSTTYRLIALAQEQLGKHDEARLACRAEIDSEILSHITCMNAPQITSYDQAVLRKLAGAYGFRCVDLPEIFKETNPESLPDREYFLDYCHLSESGIALLVDHLAAQIQTDFPEGKAGRSLPGPNIAEAHRALTYFGAAIHTAHRLLPVTEEPDLLQHWCRKALATSPEIAKVMAYFIESRVRRIPAMLSDAQQHILRSTYSLLHSHGWKYDHLDFRLISAILEVFLEQGNGETRRLTELIIRNLAIETKPCDLAGSSDFLWNPLEQAYLDLLKPADMHHRAMLRSFWPKMAFGFVSTAESDLRICLTARILNPAPGAEIRVSVNGNELGSNPGAERFNRLTYEVPRNVLACGVNRLEVAWPALNENHPWEDQAVFRLRTGMPAALAPVFGEIFSLRVEPSC